MKGILAGLALMLLNAIWLLVSIAMGYDGKCGGYFPSLAGPVPCSLWDYVTGELRFTLSVLYHEFWWAPPLILLSTCAAGYLIGFVKGKL